MQRQTLVGSVAIILAFAPYAASQINPTMGNTSVKQASARPCRYERLWIDPAGDGTPEGRSFSASIRENIAKTNKLQMVEKKEEAQITFSDNKVSARRDPTLDSNVDCNSVGDSTDCYSADYHSHADSKGSSIKYIGPYQYTYAWQLVDTKTFKVLNSGLDVPIDLRHPGATASAILKVLGCVQTSKEK